MSRSPNTAPASPAYYEVFTPSQIELDVERRLALAHTFVITDAVADDGDGSFAPLYRHAPDCPGCCVVAAVECLADRVRRG